MKNPYRQRRRRVSAGLPLADWFCPTEIQADIEGDAWFSDSDQAQWNEVSQEGELKRHPAWNITSWFTTGCGGRNSSDSDTACLSSGLLALWQCQ